MFTDTLTLTKLGIATENVEPIPIELLTHQYLIYAENIEEMSQATLPGKRSYLNDFSEYFTEFMVRELTNEQLNEYFTHLKERVSPLTKRYISPGSLNNRKRTVFVFLKWCTEYQQIPLRVNLARVKINKEPDIHKKRLLIEDIEYVIERISDHQDQLMIRLILEAGLRISELAKVKIEHLSGRRLEVVGKGNKRRTTFISLEFAEDLHSWMADNGWYGGFIFRPQLHGKKGAGYKHLDTIRGRIQRWFRAILGIAMGPHQIRHAFARRLLDTGCHLRAIQKMLGHANIETTMIYLGVDDDWLEKEYSRSLHTRATY